MIWFIRDQRDNRQTLAYAICACTHTHTLLSAGTKRILKIEKVSTKGVFSSQYLQNKNETQQHFSVARHAMVDDLCKPIIAELSFWQF